MSGKLAWQMVWRANGFWGRISGMTFCFLSRTHLQLRIALLKSSRKWNIKMRNALSRNGRVQGQKTRLRWWFSNLEDVIPMRETERETFKVYHLFFLKYTICWKKLQIEGIFVMDRRTDQNEQLQLNDCLFTKWRHFKPQNRCWSQVNLGWIRFRQ